MLQQNTSPWATCTTEAKIQDEHTGEFGFSCAILLSEGEELEALANGLCKEW